MVSTLPFLCPRAWQLRTAECAWLLGWGLGAVGGSFCQSQEPKGTSLPKNRLWVLWIGCLKRMASVLEIVLVLCLFPPPQALPALSQSLLVSLVLLTSIVLAASCNILVPVSHCAKHPWLANRVDKNQ